MDCLDRFTEISSYGLDRRSILGTRDVDVDDPDYVSIDFDVEEEITYDDRMFITLESGRENMKVLSTIHIYYFIGSRIWRTSIAHYFVLKVVDDNNTCRERYFLHRQDSDPVYRRRSDEIEKKLIALYGIHKERPIPPIKISRKRTKERLADLERLVLSLQGEISDLRRKME